MRLIFIGCVEFSRHMLSHLLSLHIPNLDIVGVVTRGKSAFNSDFASLEPLASNYDIPCFLAEGNDQSRMAEWIQSRHPDLIYCFGWSYLLNKEILDIPTVGIVGYHPAKLPHNRGRHPIIWSLVLGLKEIGSTFFFMDGGADSGDILSQEVIEIEPEDDAGTLYYKLSVQAKKQIEVFTERLISGTYLRQPQNHALANYWRKRGKDDGRIEWRMSAQNIHNLVRALAKPYAGAHFVFEAMEFKVWKTRLTERLSENIEPGKITYVSEKEFVVQCGSGAIAIVDYDTSFIPKEGAYL